MARLLWWLVMALAGWLLWRNWQRQSRDPQGRNTALERRPPPPAVRQGGERWMVACAHCGVHLPRDEALADPHGRSYCSTAHRDAGPGPAAR